MHKPMTLIFALVFVSVLFFQNPAHAQDRYSLRYVGTNITGSYHSELLLHNFSALCGIFTPGGSANCAIPKNSFQTGLNFEVSIPFAKRWAFRPVIGYQYNAWHSSTTALLKSSYKHSLAADALFDLYFNSSSKWHPFIGLGLGVRRTVEIMPVLAGGTHLDLNENVALKLEVKAGTLIFMYSFVEPSVGMSFKF